MKKVFTLLLSLTSFSAIAQTWSDDVAQIVYDKCAKCHHTGGAGGFSLTTYAEASPMAAAIAVAVGGNVMPPWPPDNNYNQYIHDRSLTPVQKTTILNWVTNGALEGVAANTPPPPVFTSAWQLGEGDLTVRIPNYRSKATINDDYVCFVLPTGLAAGRTIKAIEVLPGNVPIVHHCLVFWDAPSGTAVTDTIGGNCASPSSGTLVYGWAPGSTPMVFPSGGGLKLGMDIPANAKLVLTMHYPIGSFGELDSTKVKIHFYPLGETGIRQVQADHLLENWSFSLPPNQVTNLTARYPPSPAVIPANYSLLSIFPHMHVLGQSMKVYAIKPALDTLKLMNLPVWNFDWQGFYVFKNMQKLTAGSYLKQDGVMNNTTAATVGPGLNTTQEMFLTYLHYLPYQAGDELYDIEALSNITAGDLMSKGEAVDPKWQISPNPFNQNVEITFQGVQAGQTASLYVYNLNGEVVAKLIDKQPLTSASLTTFWNGNNVAGQEVSNGLYMLSLTVDGKQYSKRVVKN